MPKKRQNCEESPFLRIFWFFCFQNFYCIKTDYKKNMYPRYKIGVKFSAESIATVSIYIYIWAIPLLFGTFCGGMSWNGPKFWFDVVLEKLSLCINFQPPGYIPSPAIPSRSYEKCRFLSIFKNSYLGFQAINFNLAIGIFKVFSRSFSKKL